MPNLPSLQSGSTAQYPFVTSLSYATEIIHFVDGTEQRFAQTGNATRSWTIVLKDLTPSETASLTAFVDLNAPANQLFTFHDPVTGEVYSQCRLAAKPISVEQIDEQRASISLTITEVT